VTPKYRHMGVGTKFLKWLAKVIFKKLNCLFFKNKYKNDFRKQSMRIIAD